MPISHVTGLGLLLVLPLLGPRAQDAQDARAKKPTSQEEWSGTALFRTYCSSCHGREGKGDGPVADRLRVAPPDLTQIAKRNHGRFEGDRVARIIDGRDPVKGHGGADMPVWGDAFKGSREGYEEASVKARIRALVDYLEEIQAPAEAPRN